MNFFAELKRRQIYRVAAAYAVVAWVLIQLVSNISPMLRLPDWAGTLVLVLLLVGFPVALLFAWIHQLAPESSTLARVTTGRLDWALIGALVVVIALVSYEQFVPPLGAGTAQQASVSAVAQASPAASGAISIAVLPFLNLSSDKEQEFFSDGMTEEITSALVKVPGLIVIGRTSAFEFKGQNKDLRMIGQALGTTHLIEGSVRKAGTRVRITAQLIVADSGAHLWTENYDRELTDIFAVQEDIAQAIAGALRVPLGLRSGETLISSRIAEPAVHELFLLGRAQRRSGDRGARQTLETVVARAPTFAPGWAGLAGAYRAAAVTALRRDDFKTYALMTDNEEAAARKAIKLDASYVGGYAELAAVQTRRGKWEEAEDIYKQALALDSNDSETLHVYSQTLVMVGRLKEGLHLRERLRALDPLVPAYNQVTARIMLPNGQIDEAIKILEPISPNAAQRNVYLAEAYAIKGRFADAADTLLLITTQLNRRSVEDAARLLRSAPETTDAPEKFPTLDDNLDFVYPYVGAQGRMLDYTENAIKQDRSFGAISTVWRQTAATLRKTERFKSLMRKAGLVDYWRARGWPDLCRPIGADDFVCD